MGPGGGDRATAARELARRLLQPRGWIPWSALAIARTAGANAWRHRVLGLAAEAGFWQLLSMPPLLLALLGTIGYVGDAVGGDALDNVRQSILDGADNLLTASVVDDTVRPTIDQILSRGRPDVISIGFLLSLWTGSTAMATFVNTITIAYGQRELRSAVRSRLLALELFLTQVATGVILLPALVLGPGLLSDLLGSGRHPEVDTLLGVLFWPVVGVVALAMLTSLYHLALPVRRPWHRALPGATLALLLWLVGSYLLRMYLEVVFSNELVYGSLGAPVAALLFFYITALAVLLGAELNAAIDERPPRQRRTPRHSTRCPPVGGDQPPEAGPPWPPGPSPETGAGPSGPGHPGGAGPPEAGSAGA